MTKPAVSQDSLSSAVETVEAGRRWRIRGSGVRGHPATAPFTRQILDGLSSIGVDIATRSSGSAVNASSHHVSARLLDGGIQGETGNCRVAPRGVFVAGPRVLVLVAALLGRVIPSSLLAQLRAADRDIDAFIEDCRGTRLAGYPVFPATQLPNDLLRAYRETHYEARMPDAAPLTLRIDEHSPRLLAEHRKLDVSASLFITAHNPSGQRLPREENQRRHRSLMKMLQGHAARVWDGRGFHPAGGWEERSVLALGVPLDPARALGRRLGQNAIVWCGADAVPRLILLR